MFYYKKWVFVITGLIACLTLVYLMYAGYILTGGFKNYEQFCSAYIPQLNEYYSQNSDYPENISSLKKPTYYVMHEAEKCGYLKADNGFTFFAPEGFIGVAIYDSSTKKWVHD